VEEVLEEEEIIRGVVEKVEEAEGILEGKIVVMVEVLLEIETEILGVEAEEILEDFQGLEKGKEVISFGLCPEWIF
jgi:hypothetical protein